MPSPDPALSPHEVRRAGLCIGCGACAAFDNRGEAGMRFDAFGQLNPAGPRAWLHARTAQLAQICPFSPWAADEDALARERFPDAPTCDDHVGRLEAAFVGHAAADTFRAAGSSGGLVTWTAAELIRQGVVDGVAHVKTTSGDRLFGYGISRSEAEVRAGAKSRYYPVDLSEVVREIRRTPGRYAVVGIPCFIKAIQLMRRADPVLRERIAVTIGIFCGHMKSARMVESFAWQSGVRGEEVATIDFRHKDPTRPANWYAARLCLHDGGERLQDWWNFADGDWGAGFFQNSACDACDDVVAETADISFGDAWVEPYASDGRGTNVVVVRSAPMLQLLRSAIEDGHLVLTEVGADFVRRTQAAGFRQRREGLALRLAARRSRFPVRKRVAARRPPLSWRRATVYRLRQSIGSWSHRIFLVARTMRCPGLYIGWARASLTIYQALAWSRGDLGRWLDRITLAVGSRGPSQRSSEA